MTKILVRTTPSVSKYKTFFGLDSDEKTFEVVISCSIFCISTFF